LNIAVLSGVSTSEDELPQVKMQRTRQRESGFTLACQERLVRVYLGLSLPHLCTQHSNPSDIAHHCTLFVAAREVPVTSIPAPYFSTQKQRLQQKIE